MECRFIKEHYKRVKLTYEVTSQKKIIFIKGNYLTKKQNSLKKMKRRLKPVEMNPHGANT